jgi:SAM-dependent methyltransferase
LVKRGIPEEAFPWVARHRAGKLREFIKPTDVVLEYGVGYGWNLSVLNCARRIGYDVSDLVASTAREHGIEFIADLDSVAAGSIDVVICHHTLEHVLQPATVLERIRALLRPGGLLLLFVPYEKERRFRRFTKGEPNHHLFSWNAQTLGALVEETGFSVEAAGLGDFGQERFAANWAVRLRLGEAAFRWIRSVANRLKNELEVRIVARKPSP